MRLVMYTQVIEDGRPKGGDEYVVAHLTVQQACDMGQAGMEALVSKAAATLPTSGNTTHDYYEYLIGWEILDNGEMTWDEESSRKYEPERFWITCKDFQWPEAKAA